MNNAHFKWSIPVVLAVMTVVGACGIIYEYALGFLGNNLIGSSHEALVMVMSFMMASMGLGAWLQSKLFKDNLLDKFLIIEIALAFLGGISILAIYTSYSYFASYEIHLYMYVSLMGAFIGAELPLIYRVNEECKEKHGVTICPNLS
jgi:spermidine synthase